MSLRKDSDLVQAEALQDNNVLIVSKDYMDLILKRVSKDD